MYNSKEYIVKRAQYLHAKIFCTQWEYIFIIH